MKRINLYCLLVLILSNSLLANAKEDWRNFQYEKSIENLLNNISRSDTKKGVVVASPSKHDPNYYYHWVRDAALVMSSLGESLSFEKSYVLLDDYTNLVAHHQNTRTLSGLGEPKYNVDGTGYAGPWGRPQNDGPALRAITLTRFAKVMLKKGQKKYVFSKLFGDQSSQNIIRRDLDYVAREWSKHDFDLWEEVKGHHFYTRYVQRSALLMGAMLAQNLGDAQAANKYREEAMKISRALEDHWSDQAGYVLTHLDRRAGLAYKHSNLDSSVILAVNHAAYPGQSFGVSDQRIVSTAWSLVKRFKNDYPINSEHAGIAIGRYPEDVYYGGNPWFLITAGMSEYFYSLAKEVKAKGLVKVSKSSRDFYTKFLGIELKSNTISDDKTINLVVKRLRVRADQFLDKIKTHAHPNGQLDEQFSKHNGYMVGARHLTWSYAAFLTAINERNN